VDGRFGDDHLERRADVRLEQMPPVRGAVRFADDHVRVQLRLAVVQRDVADQGEHLDLLLDRDARIVLLLPVEVAEHAVPKGAERRELTG
jgi:hypothetical protein